MFEKLFNKQLTYITTEEIFAYASGEIIEIDKVPDPIFSRKIMGDGIAILPSDGRVVAPADGEIVFVAGTKHALALRTSLGLELLIHIGLETVGLKGKGFRVLTKSGDKVVKGQLLVEVDLDYIKKSTGNTIIPMVVTNNTQGEFGLQWQNIKQVVAGEIKVFTISIN